MKTQFFYFQRYNSIWFKKKTMRHSEAEWLKAMTTKAKKARIRISEEIKKQICQGNIQQMPSICAALYNICVYTDLVCSEFTKFSFIK